MLYSAVINDKVLDYKFKKNSTGYVFYIGDIYLGQVTQLRSQRWSAVSYVENRYGVMGGFGTRLDAAEYLLKIFTTIREEAPWVVDNETIREYVSQSIDISDDLQKQIENNNTGRLILEFQSIGRGLRNCRSDVTINVLKSRKVNGESNDIR